MNIVPISSNGLSGTGASVQVKVVATKDLENVGLDIALKGELNALDPYSTMDAVVTGKNIVKLSGLEYKIIAKNGTDVSDYFELSSEGNTIQIAQNYDEYQLPLIVANLDGQKVKLNVTAKYVLNGKVESNSAVKEFTVKRSAITPKFPVSKASININYEKGHTLTVTVPASEYYFKWHLDVKIYNGKQKLDTFDVISGESVNYDTGEFSIRFYDEHIGFEKLWPYVGKTLDVKVTPYIPDEITNRTFKELKTSTYKLTVLDSNKKKPSVKATVKGSINNIDDSSEVKITQKYQNIYSSEGYFISYKIYQMVGGVEKNYTGDFVGHYEEGSNINSSVCFIAKCPGATVPAGTYKIELSTCDIKTHNRICYTTTSFKVTKGKTAFTLDKSQVELVNNNTKRATFELANKNQANNVISNVEIADKSTIFELYSLGNGKYSIGFKKNADGSRYVELDKKKNPITSAVTKTVKLNVYNEGSDKPATVSIKVKIQPQLTSQKSK